MRQWLGKAEIALSGMEMRGDFPMAELTTFKIGGPADLLVKPASVDQLARVLRFCREENLPWLIVGAGSNILARDQGIRGIVVKLGGSFQEWRISGGLVFAGAAVNLGELVKDVAGRGLAGLEFACGIPGTVGGATFMNAGAYDGEIARVLKEVTAYDPLRGELLFSKAELDLGYRRSRFQQTRQVITGALFELKPAEPASLLSKIAELTRRRETRQPLELPSAGSVFRRPEGCYVGPLIEAAGLKGYAVGGAQVSLKHAGFIVNTGGATAADVLGLIAHIRRVIREKNGVELIPEIRVVGEE